MTEIWKKSIGSLLPFLVAVWAAGCGAEGPTPPAAGRAAVKEPVKEIDRKGEKRGPIPIPMSSALSETVPGGDPDDPKIRLEAINRTVQEGEPEALEILYEALADPDRGIQKEAVEWLEVLVKYDPEVRPRLEALQEKERNADRWHRLSDVLAEPAPEWADMTAEETSGNEGES